MPSNTRRVARNTLMLYFRQVLIMLVSLYTVRVVLETLGAEDYGIYNVVAGVVTMFGFLSGSMAVASQRFFAFELGRGDLEQLKRVFSISLVIYALIALIVLLLAETIGLWFVTNKLVIPQERAEAALWIYHFSTASFLFTVLTAPYMAMITAHEDMNIYAAVSIVEAVLKLVIVFLLRIIALDKLQLYGVLLCVVTAVNTGIYRTVCKRKYQECKFRFYWDKGLFKAISGFTGWNLSQIIAGIFKWQMNNILLNQFFNQIIISARGISLSVSSTVAAFSSNLNVALKPQIIKEYAKENREHMFYLMFRGIAGAWFLMYAFILPLMLETQIVLSLWLKKVPDYTVVFVRLALLDELIYSIGHPINAVVQASGKIRLYEFTVGMLCCLNFPLALAAFYLGAPSFSVFVIGIVMTLAAFVAKLLISRLIVQYSMMRFFRTVIAPISGITIVSSILPITIWGILKPGFLRLCAVVLVSVVSIGLCVYAILLDGDERKQINNIVKNKIRREHHS